MLVDAKQAASSSGEAASVVANAAAAAAAAGIGPAGDANEAARSLRLRQAIMGDTAGGAGGSAAGTADPKAVESPSNSFSRSCQPTLTLTRCSLESLLSLAPSLWLCSELRAVIMLY